VHLGRTPILSLHNISIAQETGRPAVAWDSDWKVELN
jgi:hypothetical protein